MPADRKIWLGQTGYLKLSSDSSGHTLGLYDDNDNLLDSDTDSIPNTGDYLDCTFCYSRNVLSATVTGGSVSLCVDAAVTGVAGSVDTIYAYLGGDSGATFDNFTFYKTYSTDEPSDGDCDTCPDCPLLCTNCCSDPVETQYLVDLGAGGWTYGGECAIPGSSCNACADANGEFLVVHAGVNCQWFYTDRDNCIFDCVTGFFGNPGDRPIFSIILGLNKDGTGKCKWEVVVSMTKSNGTASFDCTGAGAASTVTYQSDYLDTTADCQTMPVTLTKVSEAGDCPCTGSLPATITFRNAV